jgi:hypothetical protein
MDRWMVGYMDECFEGWLVFGWVDGWLGGRKDGW